ncbi:MAG: flavodoxin family protein [Methanomassiliicoccales archaeon]|nr:flavodoxin family protein [Methanomassiliicoccales archaeon]
MKVIAFNGSPRQNGNTAKALGMVLETLQKEGIETEMVQMGSEDLHGCKGCATCVKNKDERCIFDADKINQWIQMIKGADGIIIGSPTYFGGLSSQTKAFIDRVGYVSRANDNLFRRKVGAAVAINRRAGSLNTFDEINHFFLISEMIVPGATYWNVGQALRPGDMLLDEEGMKTMQSLGRNMAWLLKKLH